MTLYAMVGLSLMLRFASRSCCQTRLYSNRKKLQEYKKNIIHGFELLYVECTMCQRQYGNLPSILWQTYTFYKSILTIDYHKMPESRVIYQAFVPESRIFVALARYDGL